MASFTLFLPPRITEDFSREILDPVQRKKRVQKGSRPPKVKRETKTKLFRQVGGTAWWEATEEKPHLSLLGGYISLSFFPIRGTGAPGPAISWLDGDACQSDGHGSSHAVPGFFRGLDSRVTALRSAAAAQKFPERSAEAFALQCVNKRVDTRVQTHKHHTGVVCVGAVLHAGVEVGQVVKCQRRWPTQCVDRRHHQDHFRQLFPRFHHHNPGHMRVRHPVVSPPQVPDNLGEEERHDPQRKDNVCAEYEAGVELGVREPRPGFYTEALLCAVRDDIKRRDLDNERNHPAGQHNQRDFLHCHPAAL